MFSEIEDKRSKKIFFNKGAPIALLTQEIPRVWGNCGPGNMNKDQNMYLLQVTISHTAKVSKVMEEMGHLGRAILMHSKI